jgi:hypothetical protein
MGWLSLLKFVLLTVWIAIVSVTAIAIFQPKLSARSDAVYACLDKMKQIGFTDFHKDTMGIVVNSDYATSLVSFISISEGHIECLVHNRDDNVGLITQGLEVIFYKHP